jgi:DNA-binding CsgD family transcriptional regulator
MRRIQDERIGAVVDRIYEAAGRSELWPAVLEEVNAALCGKGTILIPGPASPFSPVFTEWFAEPVDVAVRSGWIDNNPRVARAIKVGGPQDVFTESMLFSRWELDHLPYNAEYVNQVGGRWFAGMAFAGFGPSGLFLSIERGPEQEKFSHREIDILRRMLPHVQRAGQLAARLAGARAEGLLGGLAALDCAGLLVGRRGMVVGCNDKAERLLGRGLSIRLGLIAADHPASNTALHRLIGSVVRPGPAHEAHATDPIAVARPFGRPLIVHAAPVVGSAEDAFQAAKAILMIVDPDEHREPRAVVLRHAFGLTAAEADVALMLARGTDLDEIAAARGVSLGTIRQQLKAIFLKTETRRQAELVALVMRLAPSLDRR